MFCLNILQFEQTFLHDISWGEWVSPMLERHQLHCMYMCVFGDGGRGGGNYHNSFYWNYMWNKLILQGNTSINTNSFTIANLHNRGGIFIKFSFRQAAEGPNVRKGPTCRGLQHYPALMLNSPSALLPRGAATGDGVYPHRQSPAEGECSGPWGTTLSRGQTPLARRDGWETSIWTSCAVQSQLPWLLPPW